MTNSDPMMNWDEAVTYVMRATGKSRRQATAALIEKCRQGAIRATGLNAETDDRETVPPAYFPSVN